MSHDAENYVLAYLEHHLGVPAQDLRKVKKQILILGRVYPHFAAYKNKGQEAADGTDLRLTGEPSPSSDPKLQNALIRFTRAKRLRKPSYDEKKHMIVFERPLDTFDAMLQAMKDSPAVFCWIGLWPGHTYADVHCVLDWV